MEWDRKVLPHFLGCGDKGDKRMSSNSIVQGHSDEPLRAGSVFSRGVHAS